MNGTRTGLFDAVDFPIRGGLRLTRARGCNFCSAIESVKGFGSIR